MERAPGIVCINLTCKPVNTDQVAPKKTFIPVPIGNGDQIISERDKRRKTRSAKKEEQIVIKEIKSEIDEETVSKKSEYE
jgi:hypothetical protein